MKQHLIPLVVATSLVAILSGHAATTLGVNFYDNSINAQVNGNFGATWTNVVPAAGSGLAINGTPSTTMHWTASQYSQAGSWTSSTVGNLNGTPISLMRKFLNDGDTPAAGAPASLGSVLGDGIGVSVNLQGLSAWLISEGATAYTIRAFFNTETNDATFQSITVHDGNSITSPMIETITPTVQGNGQWNGTNIDGGGNLTDGTRGDAIFATQFTQDNITLTLPIRNGNARGTLAGFVITAVPEPSVILLGCFGILALFRRRRP